jgi:hypothetical protein
MMRDATPDRAIPPTFLFRYFPAVKWQLELYLLIETIIDHMRALLRRRLTPVVGPRDAAVMRPGRPEAAMFAE